MTVEESAHQVSVHLSDCEHETADTVLDVLRAAFSEVLAPERAGQGAGGTGAVQATVWSMAVDARSRRDHGTEPAAHLGSPVTAELYGSADPIRLVRQELQKAFVVEHLGTVPGEHEMESRLRLTNREAPAH
ncbi:hypothetical protein DEJ50_31555 [Streptomyces venezuelae]|uniref:Uncharacterized protein n=1 Tax=Streptomyces venezuelae TaxID=54571 RepID=A0A5P2D981_STRVZ|nr:hypothetical protein [Streptomyces venezuelae]QES51714.1 hypothetical protein DEJ50_31555 [Streptomyces venezuelae]